MSCPPGYAARLGAAGTPQANAGEWPGKHLLSPDAVFPATYGPSSFFGREWCLVLFGERAFSQSQLNVVAELVFAKRSTFISDYYAILTAPLSYWMLRQSRMGRGRHKCIPWGAFFRLFMHYLRKNSISIAIRFSRRMGT